jgi:glycosyltransferase involved in cell wall biosynthesis
MSINLKTILVDLTPVLPGGANGGAKIFAIKLITCMALANPETKFILLTKASAYQELEYMDSMNVSRIMVGGSTNNNSLASRVIGYAFRKIPNIPNKISLLGYKIIAKLRRHAQKKLLTEINPDLIFCPFTAPTYAMPNIPLVSVIYDLQYKTHPIFFTKADVKNRDHTFTEACRVATKLVAISDYSRQSAILHGKIDSDKIQTIHLYMANRNLSKTEANNSNDTLDRFSLKKKQYFLYPANFWPHKNHEMLLTAFKIAKHENKIMDDIKLVCTGAPSERQKFLISTAKKMGLESQVLFIDFLKDVDLANLMQNCKAFVFPSLYEGFGLPVLEAMAFDVPVACSNLTSLPEVAADAALFFDPRIPSEIANAMVEIVKNESICEKLINAGRERVKIFFDSNQMAKKYWTLFESI